jgi:uncharacterized membrane protein (Fun14 family)
MDTSSLIIPGAEFGGGGLVGFMMGYGLKKIAKLLLILFSGLVALAAIVLAALSYTGIITINYAAATPYITQAESYVIPTATWLYTIIGGMTQGLPILAGVGMGFTLGLAKG